MSRIVLLGSQGMLGRAVQARLSRAEQSFAGFDRAELDIGEPQHINRVIGRDTRWVFNCAAWTDVDAAEASEAEARRVNGDAVGPLARRCAEVGATLVHYSTDYVFSGAEGTPYATDGERVPINAYGRTKLVGERLLEASGCEYLLVRTSWLYAPWGKNFVKTMLGLMRTRPSVRVVEDQVGRPTHVETLADSSWRLLEQQARGVFHVSDAGQCSWFQFAEAIRDEAGLPCTVEACTSNEFPRPARRPGYSVLSLEKTEAALGPLAHWREPLRRCVSQLSSLGAVLLVVAVALLAGCGSPNSASGATEPSGLPADKELGELSHGEIEQLCSWGEALAGSVDCADGSSATRPAQRAEACIEQWPVGACTVTVAGFEACSSADPCDAETASVVCASLLACEFAEGNAAFRCANGLGQVPDEVVCDGFDDCQDASDESDCGDL